MSIEIRPLGVDCNLACSYCYQTTLRSVGSFPATYDPDRVKAAAEEYGEPLSLFGGEPLLLPLDDLDDLLAWSFARYGGSSIQTNGTRIGEDHLALFKRYRVRVGVSMDGPGALNDARRCGDRERTRAMTRATERAVEALCREGLAPSLIVTLHRLNASAQRLPELVAWIRHLDVVGVRAIRLHVLEIDTPEVRAELALTPGETLAALRALRELKGELRLHFDRFRDMEAMLLGRDAGVTCSHRGCDPLATRAVRGVRGDGRSSNCGRTHEAGVDFLQAAEPGFERYLALYQTPQPDGGCADCRFFLMCKGDCPGCALDGDWRNRSEYCEVWKPLYASIEADLLARGELPLSVSPRRSAVEAALLEQWALGRNPDIADLLLAGRRNGPAGSLKDPPHEDYKDAPFNDGHRDTPGHSDTSWEHEDGHMDAWEDGWL